MQVVSQLYRVSPIIHPADTDRFWPFQNFTIFFFILVLVSSLTFSSQKKNSKENSYELMKTSVIKTDHLTVFQQYRPVSADFTKLGSGGLGLTSMFANNDNEKPSATNNVLLITCECFLIYSHHHSTKLIMNELEP